MKRFILFILILVLSVSSASAGCELRAECRIDPELFGEYLSLCGFDEKNAASISSVSGELSRHLNVSANISDQNGHMELFFDETSLFEIDWTERDASWLVHCSLIPGVQFSVPAVHVPQLLAYAEAIAAAVQGELDSMQSLDETGRFWGYAYTDGNVRKTAVLNQTEMVHVLELLSQVTGISDNPLIQQFLSQESQAAEEERYALHVSRVYREDILIGLSFTLMDRSEAVAALSLGRNEQDIRAVFGAGMNNAAYYFDLSASIRSDDSLVNASLDFYRDPIGMGFEAVQSYDMSLGSVVLNLGLTEEDAEKRYSMEMQLEKEKHAIMSQQGTLLLGQDAARLDMMLFLPDNAAPFYEADLEVKQSSMEPLVYPFEEETVISICDLRENIDTVRLAAISGIQNAVMKLIPLLPESFQWNIFE